VNRLPYLWGGLLLGLAGCESEADPPQAVAPFDSGQAKAPKKHGPITLAYLFKSRTRLAQTPGGCQLPIVPVLIHPAPGFFPLNFGLTLGIMITSWAGRFLMGGANPW
jgi:hypothetical protein